MSTADALRAPDPGATNDRTTALGDADRAVFRGLLQRLALRAQAVDPVTDAGQIVDVLAS
jgi:hypothetical protein